MSRVTEQTSAPADAHQHHKLKELLATAVCGNDIMSSCLYVSGVAILLGGIYGPLVLLFIGVVLFLYKKVYTEAVEALPVNGGAYNCLLNATSKSIASIAGVMTILSYIATAVISGNVGVEYLATIFPERLSTAMEHLGMMLPFKPEIVITVALLLLFAMLVIGGIKDSARVAFGIFVTHIAAMTLFVILGAIYLWQGHGLHFADTLATTHQLIAQRGSLPMLLFLTFSGCLLGVSGFESSANFVEEQEKGVFRKTLRNMLIGVVIFNPLIALVVLGSLPYETVVSAKDFLLAESAQIIGGTWFKYVVVIDAFLVLWGAVLTSFVGVSGLIYRMSADSCLPSFLTKVNAKGSYPRIVLIFFALCSSILILTNGNLLSLAGVYTIAFLGVMTLFAFGNLVLKEVRSDLKRTYRAPVLFVTLAMFSTMLGMVGNVLIDSMNLAFFSMYFFPAIAIVFAIIYQDYLMRFLLRATTGAPFIQRYMQQHFSDITSGKFVIFLHHVNRLYQALQYVDRNETGRNITLICCKNPDISGLDDDYEEIREALPYLKKIGMFPHLTIDLLHKEEPFGPEVVEAVSRELGVRKNRILIGSIHDFHRFDYDELGGLRIIFG